MKIDFYSTIVKDENKIFHGFAFSVLPSLVISECEIYLYWLFWRISIDYSN